jgi:DNA-binding MarR family transcriptional regulator
MKPIAGRSSSACKRGAKLRRPRPVKSQAGKRAGRWADYVLDEQVGFLMRVAMQRHTSLFMSRMIEGLTQTQFAALAKLLECGPTSQNQLGRLIFLDAATIKGVVDRLRARGYLTSYADPRDRRRRAIALSNAGTSAIKAAVLVGKEITAATLKPLTPREKRAVTRLLKKLG